jgi:transcriptional regulator
MADKADIRQGTLALMVLKTLEILGPLHGYGIARRIEQTSGDLLAINYGTLYPALLKLEQECYIAPEWGVSDNNRKAKFYKLTRAGHRQLARETRDWEQTTAILARFFSPLRSPDEDKTAAGLACAPGLVIQQGSARAGDGRGIGEPPADAHR